MLEIDFHLWEEQQKEFCENKRYCRKHYSSPGNFHSQDLREQARMLSLWMTKGGLPMEAMDERKKT